MTQKQLAEKCSMSESTLRQYEIGYRNPKIETLIKIANALGVEYTDLAELPYVKPTVANGYVSREHYESMNTETNQEAAFASLLRNIFGYLEERAVHVDGVGQSYYYAIGNDGKVLDETLYDGLYEKVELYIREYFKHFAISESDEIEYAQKMLLQIRDMLNTDADD